MNCLKHCKQANIPADVFIKSLSLYYKMGWNPGYKTLFHDNREMIVDKLIERESLSFYRFFFPDDKIKSSRFRSLRLSSSVANNNREQRYINIYRIFSMIHDRDADFKLTIPEIMDLVRLFYDRLPEGKRIAYQKVASDEAGLLSQEKRSRREDIEKMIDLYETIKKENIVEHGHLNLCFMLDFLNMEIFKIPDHEAIALLIYYILNMVDGYHVTHYESFFEKMLVNRDEYRQLLKTSVFQWSEGLADVTPLRRFFIRLYNNLYDSLSETARDYEYENNLAINKTDYVENTIYKLPEVFSKDDVRKRHPTVSDSTINRTLKRLHEQNKIRPLGKGRAAKWMRIDTKENDRNQLYFDLGDE